MADFNVKGASTELVSSAVILFISLGISSTYKWFPFAVGFALIYCCSLYALKKLNAGWCNPALTLSLYILKRIKGKDACAYIVAQMSGAYIGAAVAYATLGAAHPFSSEESWGTHSDFSNISTAIAEITMSTAFILTFLKLSTSDNNSEQFWGISISGVLVSAYASIGYISGSCLNPALSFGCDMAWLLSGKRLQEISLVTHIISPFIGAMIAIFIIKMLRNFLFAEFIGLVFITYVIACAKPITDGSNSFYICLGIAFIHMAMIYCMGPHSGGHLNPAISVAFLISGKIRAADVLAYVGIQIFGSIFGAFLAMLTCGNEISSVFDETQELSPQLIIFTVAFCALLVCAYTLSFNGVFGTPAALCISACILAFTFVTHQKTALNPGVMSGLAVYNFITGKSAQLSLIFPSIFFPVVLCVAVMAVFKLLPSDYQPIRNN